ncbi:MAG TPA: hypothetical protein VMW69_16790, partial [Spirochaetia bacterium]|nr:hypothetical protein [Spirochaetia bacterium]
MSPAGRTNELDIWKSALLKLPDGVFFDIMRNYLGELKTPFNKHSLIEELSSFLRSRETQARILRHIDETDSRLLTSVQILEQPSVERLFTFFEGSMTYLELHYLLLNLQERLLVFIGNESHSQRLFLNPLLSALLRREVIDPDLLFPSRAVGPLKTQLPWPSESLLLSLFSYLSSMPDLLKSDGDLKKRALEEIVGIFPELGSSDRFAAPA